MWNSFWVSVRRVSVCLDVLKKTSRKFEATVVYTEVLASVNFLAVLSHKPWLAQKSMLLHITDFMKFWDTLSYRLTVAPLVQHHSVDTYKTIINFSHLCPAVVFYIINTVSFRSRSITCQVFILRGSNKNLYFKRNLYSDVVSYLQDTSIKQDITWYETLPIYAQQYQRGLMMLTPLNLLKVLLKLFPRYSSRVMKEQFNSKRLRLFFFNIEILSQFKLSKNPKQKTVPLAIFLYQ